MTNPDINTSQAGDPAPRKRLRLWLGGVAVVLWLLRFVIPDAVPAAMLYSLAVGFVGGVAVIFWWVFFSREPRGERWAAIALMIVAEFTASRLLHKSIAEGHMGMTFPLYSISVLYIAFTFWAMFSLLLSDGVRRATMVATILLACGIWPLLRTDGIIGLTSLLHWRWTPTHEERLLAAAATLPAAAAPAKIPAEEPEKVTPTPTPTRAPAAASKTTVTAAEWPGFRGPNRDGIIPGIQIKTDWSVSPPVELWRKPIGPGWSSFAVHGDLIYTQEQRGEDEFVTCYSAKSGDAVWAHRDAARFYESNGGPGPRGTPTLHNGRVYALGATGIVNALDAADGKVLWSHNAGTDTGAALPGWGFAGSPLVVGDVVIAAASGRLVAYDLSTGARRWTAETGGGGYSSPHLVKLGGDEQVVLMTGAGAASVSPADGTVLWKFAASAGVRIVQPAMTPDDDLLITSGNEGMGGSGMRRIAVTHGPGGWTATERWASVGLKPNFNDLVVHDGYVYGFDGAIMACIDLKDGTRKWKGGRYGSGELVLLRDQGVLLVVSEEGELALVKAAPDQFTELARFPAMDGKTWNHPVLVGDRLLVRNDNQMVAFRLALEPR